MKIAMTSDNHFDINKVNVDEILVRQVEYLLQNQIRVYLIAGDLFNDFQKSLEYTNKLQTQLGKNTKVLFIAGNHDMVRNVSYEELESPISDEYLHNQFYDIPDTDWRVIGNNGWYDYSLATNMPDKIDKDFRRWKNSFWIDSVIKQPMTDQERMDIVLEQTEVQLKQAEGKKVIFMNHFVPTQEFIKFTNDNRFWNMANGVMGSIRLGKLLTNYRPEFVLFGHLHHHFEPLDKLGTTYLNQSVGYQNRRLNEWTYNDFFTEWKSRLKIVNLI